MTKNWEKEKERMHELYIARNMKLASVIEIMIKQYGFQASERAYKQKFKEWQWFKKTQRSPCTPHAKQESLSTVDDGSDNSPSRSAEQQHQQQHHLYRYHHQRGPSRGMPPHMEQPYADQYSSLPFDTHHYPVVNGVDLDVYGNPTQHMQSHHMGPPAPTGGMTLGPYGRGVAGSQVSLPSVSTLQRVTAQRANFNENLREAERRLDVGQYEHAENALENALRTLHWLKESGN